MRTIYFLKGLPGSGKSFWAKNHQKENPGMCTIVNNDTMQETIFGGMWNKNIRLRMIEIEEEIVYASLKNGMDVIIDNTHFNPVHEERARGYMATHLEWFPRRNIRFKEISFVDVPIKTCIERDSKRKQPVGEKVIMDMAARYKIKEAYPEIIKHNSDLSDCIIYDLDGTTSLSHGRSFYDASTADKDYPNLPVIMTLQALEDCNPRVDFIAMSAREEKYRDPTIKFLEENKVPFDFLLMRPNADFRKDCIVKAELYKKQILNNYNVLMIWDDRTQVVNMWRELGLTVFQVAKGDF